MAKPLKTLLERFQDKYIPEPMSGCWLWISLVDGKGYGYLRNRIVDGRRKVLKAHRVSWTLHNGEIPAGFQVCHKCDIPGCVNPRHLFIGTNSDNQLDSVSKQRHHCTKKTHCASGHAFDAINTYIAPSGQRACNECRRTNSLNYYYRKVRPWVCHSR